ncbi:hypothetical protein QA612_01880 [Evansella sp. AB-P1]|uniref:DUF6944 family repetitive protein n=1 Tax=Evansella sp. AB-P1 TaxID=3037653 RepID=UPI00241D7170|nr:hypothetical protein [Evansella sp. AB-P1]MDG5786222.1 hypothetical protein [Evansella sp. AB-P1]
MSDQLLDVIGNWVESIGATIAAIGETKQVTGPMSVGLQIGSVGNAVQGIGNSLQAIANVEDDGAKTGNWIQAAGTAANSIAEYRMKDRLDMDILEEQHLEILGDVLQSTGSMLASIERLGQNPKLVYGNLLQSIGAAIEGIGVYIAISSNSVAGQKIEMVGGWLQSFGTTYQAVGATREYLT